MENDKDIMSAYKDMLYKEATCAKIALVEEIAKAMIAFALTDATRDISIAMVNYKRGCIDLKEATQIVEDHLIKMTAYEKRM